MKSSTKNICLTAVFAALICIVTIFIQIPIPLGYFNIGNALILICCCLIPAPYGILAGSFGSAIADLITFPVWTIPTLVIKALMPLLFYILKKTRLPLIPIAVISMLIPLAGYTLCGAIIYGSIATGISQLPGLIIEYAANIVLFSLLSIKFGKREINREIK